MKNLVKIDGHPSISRDLKSNAVINTDNNAFDYFVKKRSAEIRSEEKIIELDKRLLRIEQLLENLLSKKFEE